MAAVRVIRLAVGVGLLLISISVVANFGVWQAKLAGMSADGNVEPYTWLALRIMLLSLFAPGILLLTWKPCCKLLNSVQIHLDRIPPGRFCAAVLIAAAALRILTVIALPSQLVIDWAAYHELATLWATTGQYTDGHCPTAYLPPGWPFFLSRLYLIVGANPNIGLIANIALSVGIVYYCFHLTRKIWSDTPARWTAIILAIFPTQILYTNLLCSEVLFTMLFLLALLFSLGIPSGRAGGLPQSLLAGLFFGFAALVRSLVLVFPALMLPSIFLLTVSKRKAILRWLIMVAGVAVVTTPWIIRNHLQVGQATISTNGGVNFYIGNNSHAVFGFNIPDTSIFKLDDALHEADNDRHGYQLGWAYIQQAPGAFLRRGIMKVTYMMISDITGLAEEQASGGVTTGFTPATLRAIVTQSFYYLFLIFVGFGLARYFSKPANHNAGGQVFILAILYWLIVHFVFFGDGRFHFPIVPLMAGFAGLAIADITRRSANRPSANMI